MEQEIKKYWIEKIEYPEGDEGFADCIPYGENSYDDKEFALQEFMNCINTLSDRTTRVALYEVENDYDTRIRIYDNGKIINEE
tara:strand:- start:142 stop:390 length:249 start_codon:yes stop_codon:yes gene_type:complete